MIKKGIIAIVILVLCSGFGTLDRLRSIAVKNQIVCADCSGTASFIWEINSTTVGDGSPCGCSDGDTTATGTGNVSISSGAAIFNDTGANGQDYYAFDNGADVLSDDTAGTVFIGIKVVTWADTAEFFKIYGNSTNNIRLYLNSLNDFYAVHIGNSDNDVVALSGNNVATGTNYVVRYRWQTGGAADHEITLFPATDLGTATETNNDADSLTAFSVEAGDGDFIVGNNSATASSNVKIGFVHTYKEYRDTDPNFNASWITGM